MAFTYPVIPTGNLDKMMPFAYRFIAFVFLLSLGYLTSCDDKTEQKTGKLSRYQIKATPDSAVFGKHQEVVLSIKNLKAADVWNKPENDTSIEITYDLEVTSKKKMNDKSVFVDPRHFRLVLNNRRKLTHAFYNALGADPQSTTISTHNIFNLPANTKPVALDLFFADSVARLNISLK